MIESAGDCIFSSPPSENIIILPVMNTFENTGINF